MATHTWAEGVWIGKWCTEQKEAWLSQIRVMCATRDLGIKWPQWHALFFEGEVLAWDMFPKRCEEDALATGQISLLEEVGQQSTSAKN